MRSNNVSVISKVSICPIIVEGLTKMGILALWGFNLYFFLQVNSHNQELGSNTWQKWLYFLPRVILYPFFLLFFHLHQYCVLTFYRVQNKPYVELKDSNGRRDEIVAREVKNMLYSNIAH